ncbi:unnamed protein product [Brugia timori]|uniref:Uncharacterized protein n=1 Tax=Brugia timori TaxID=42155 RepID=A0A0R3QX02_9BILA|nr:unnamed protein product [Brugia timori]
MLRYVTLTNPETNKIAYMMKLNLEIIRVPTMTSCNDIIVATISKMIEGSFLFQEFSGHPELFMSKILTLKFLLTHLKVFSAYTQISYRKFNRQHEWRRKMEDWTEQKKSK